MTWNSEREVGDLLRSIGEHLPEPYEVIVVDNASSDDTVQIAERWTGPIKVIRLDENRGFGAANNVGVRHARHKAVVLLNPDALLIDDSLVSLAELALETNSLCGPELLNLDGSRQPSASASPAGWEVGVQAVLPAALLPKPLRMRCEPWRAAHRVEVGWLTGACVAAPVQALRSLGPFDERLHLYGEDLDLGLRAQEQGLSCVFAPDVARVIHVGKGSSAKRTDIEAASEKICNRRTVVRRRLGVARERYDFGTQALFHATRYGVKTLMRRDAWSEREWLEAARRLRRHARPSIRSTTDPDHALTE